jgi:methionyl aminopeptidase
MRKAVSRLIQKKFRNAPPVLKGKVSPMLSVPNHLPYPEYALSGDPGESPQEIICYSKEEIPKVRRAARLARKILEFALSHAQPGVSTDDIDKLAHNEIIKHNAYPSPLNYYRFPKSICTSVNEVVCHGIPDDRVLNEGDIIKIDVSVFLDGYHGDNCGTVMVGKNADEKLQRLIEVTKESVQKAIEVCKPGVSTCEIGKTIEVSPVSFCFFVSYFGIQGHAKANKLSVVREFCGHGVGRFLHMQPLVDIVTTLLVPPFVPSLIDTTVLQYRAYSNEIWNVIYDRTHFDGR